MRAPCSRHSPQGSKVRQMTLLKRILLAMTAALGTCFSGNDAVQAGADSGSSTVAEIDLGQKTASLHGSKATLQLVATGKLSSEQLEDLTRKAVWSSLDPQIAMVDARGKVVPKGNGETTIVAAYQDKKASTTVKVDGMEAPAKVSFRNDVIAAFSQAGCNMGSCHGTPTGKGGFRLSLRGYLPDQDYSVLTREAGARRLNVMAADKSLILEKPLGEVPHEGGLRLSRSSKTFEMIHDWIAQGALDDPSAPKAVKLELSPPARVLNGEAETQQIAATVHYADGTSRDVTQLCYYNSSNNLIADVAADGFVSFKTPGEAAIIAHYLDLVANVRLTHLVDVPGFRAVDVPGDNFIDKAVYSKLNRMRIPPSEISTDGEFLRRVYLDVCGVLPSLEETKAFLADASPDKRVGLVDRLLDKQEYVDFWTLKFADVLRSNGRLLQTKGAYAFNRWIRAAIEHDEPLDQFARDLLTSEGSTFKNPAANYYRISRDPESSVETTAQLFLGVRIQCAKCHNHPFERWTQDDYYGFASFFSGVRHKPGNLAQEEVVFASTAGDVRQPRSGKSMKPKALGGPIYDDGPSADPDRRARLAKWLTSPENPFFAKCLVNRVWFHLMGRGIVEPVDDFRDSNPAANDELLDALAADFVKNHCSLKHLIKSIVASRSYQLSARTNTLNANDAIYFSHSYTKLLPAEVLLDAISVLTGTSTSFDGLPKGSRATQIADGKMENAFLKTFGKPARELACECERESDSNLSQALQLIGGDTVNGKLRDDTGRMAKLAASNLPPEAVSKELYLLALSREPNATELAAAIKHFKSTPDRRQAVEDLGWVLINSKEFLFRH